MIFTLPEFPRDPSQFLGSIFLLSHHKHHKTLPVKQQDVVRCRSERPTGLLTLHILQYLHQGERQVFKTAKSQCHQRCLSKKNSFSGSALALVTLVTWVHQVTNWSELAAFSSSSRRPCRIPSSEVPRPDPSWRTLRHDPADRWPQQGTAISFTGMQADKTMLEDSQRRCGRQRELLQHVVPAAAFCTSITSLFGDWLLPSLLQHGRTDCLYP